MNQVLLKVKVENFARAERRGNSGSVTCFEQTYFHVIERFCGGYIQLFLSRNNECTLTVTLIIVPNFYV